MKPTIATRVPSALLVALIAYACGGGGGSDDTGTDSIGDTAADDTASGDTSGDETGDAATDGETDSTVPCTVDGDCEDGIFCNGEETCGATGECEAGGPPDCDDGDPCTADSCDEDSSSCVHGGLDGDGDGFPAATAPGGETCAGGTDCDDGDGAVYPAADDSGCDLVDADCDGSTDENIDDDEDGWIDEACDGMADGGTYLGFGDCDDGDDAFHPEAAEGCETLLDNDCDGISTDIESDSDGDGHAADTCTGGDDCNDSDPATYPGAAEACDDVDQDCDGAILDAAGADDDSDGYLDAECDGGDDCDDGSGAIHPGAAEACDAVDDDCDGSWADGGADDDLDGYLDTACGGNDCDDGHAIAHPGAAEVCQDGIDGDCDGVVDGLVAAAGSPVQVSEAAGRSIGVAAAWSGSACGVIWPDDRVPNNLFFAQVSPAGAKIGSDVQVTSRTDSSTEPDMVWTGSEWGVAWHVQTAATHDIYFARLSASGAKVTSDVLIASNGMDAGHPAIAWTGTEFGIAWEHEAGFIMYYTQIAYTHVSAEGVPLASYVLLTSGSGNRYDPGLAWGGSQLGVTFSSTASGMGYDVYLTLITTGGGYVAGLNVTNAAGNQSMASLAWSGTQFGVAWEEGSIVPGQIGFARVNPNGTKSGTSIAAVDAGNGPRVPSIAWTGTEFAIAWMDQLPVGDEDLYLTRVSGGGALYGPGVLLSGGVLMSYEPDLAWSGSHGFGVAFESRPASSDEAFLALAGFCE